MSEEASGAAEVAAAWRAAQEGLPSVVRFTGDPSAALDALAQPVIETWPVDALPEGPSQILWFAGDAAGRAAADRVVAAVVLLRLPWLVVLSGPQALELGVPYGLVVPRGAAGRSHPTQVTGFSVPEEPERLEQAVVDAAEDGRPGDAASLLRELEARAPDRAFRHRWLHVARAFYLGRNDAIEEARRQLVEGPGLARVLVLAGQLTLDREVSLHLMRQAVRCAESEAERRDAVYYRNRTEASRGQRAPSEVGEPRHGLFLANARFSPASREGNRSASPGKAWAELEAMGTTGSRALLSWVAARYDLQNMDWIAAARVLIATGFVRAAGWMLAESIQYRPDHSRYREGLLQLGLPRMVRAAELTRLLDTFDAEPARRLAKELLSTENNVAMRCFGRVMLAAAVARLDDDPKPLAELHRPELREQLQASFCTVLSDAAVGASEAMKARLLVLASDWAEAVDALTSRRLEWLEELRGLSPDRIPLGAYDLDGELQAGGMGSVWLGEHTRLGSVVAVKFIRPEAIAHAAAFEEEVAVLATLDHPAVVQVLDVGEVTEATEAVSGGQLVAGTPFVVMEYVPGGTLADHRGTLPWADLRDLLLALLDALAYVHARGLLHRDLKPQNVLVGESDAGLYVRLSDFGLSGEAMRGEVAGTPAYMAPEQFSGLGLGAWSDLYAVGCIATALLTGVPPFVGSESQLRRAHVSRPVPPLGTRIPVPEGFEAWRMRLLAKAPEDRFATARAASLALRALPPLDSGVATLPVELAELEDSRTFIFETMVGAVLPEPVPVTPSRGGLRTVLPGQGFAERPIRPRVPTDRLFGRFPSPCLGQLAARQAVWEAAVEAYRTEAIAEVGIRVPPGMSLDRVLGWARRRLRELGVDVAADDHADFQLGTEVPARHGLQVREDSDAAVSLERLDLLQSVAQIRVQVEVTHDLAWELASRAHGLPDLIDTLLAAVIRYPGLVTTDAGLDAGGPLPDPFPEEAELWQRVRDGLEPDALAAVDRAALAPSGSVEPLGVPDGLLAGPPGERWLAVGLAAVTRTTLAEAGAAEALHRQALEAATTDYERGWHRLGAGDARAAEPLLRAALPDPHAARALARCLDLQLVAPDDPRRVPLEPAPAPGPLPVVPDADVDLDALGREASLWLEQAVREGPIAERGFLEACVLASRAGEPGGEWEVLSGTGRPEWTPALVEASRRRAIQEGRRERPAEVEPAQR